MSAALKFKQAQQPDRQSGELARIKILSGPDMGSVFILTGAKASIGRGEDNDIVLTDLRASRRHCELVFSNGAWSVVDSGSVNGIALNGKASRGSAIRTRDTISLGETVIEFFTVDAGDLVLVAPAGSVEDVLAERKNFDAQRARIQAMSKFGGLAKNVPKADKLAAASQPKRAAPAPSKPADQRKLLMIGAVVLIGAYLFLSDGSPPPKPKAPDKVDDKDMSALEGASGMPADSDAVAHTADMFFRAGFREYRLGNYLRAKMQFENVLQMSPGHRLAKIYLKNASHRIDEEVKDHLDIGRKNLDSGKLNEAKGHFETVMRLLFRDPRNPAYIEARDQLERVRKALAGGVT
jgi:pSer/pThr/pTyr-binding forkhead associated (FHA) protein